MRLFHFSHDGGIERFDPRPVATPAPRPPGRDWLNGPLVWAISDERRAMYTFPRECPRILLWATPRTTPQDRDRWLGEAQILALVEEAWMDRLAAADIWRYGMPPETFQDLDDAGMWVSADPVRPDPPERLTDLPARLAEAGATLAAVPSLTAWRGVWDTTLHASGIRLRNARDWT